MLGNAVRFELLKWFISWLPDVPNLDIPTIPGLSVSWAFMANFIDMTLFRWVISTIGDMLLAVMRVRLLNWLWGKMS